MDVNVVRVLLVAVRWRRAADQSLTFQTALERVCNEARIHLHPRQRKHLESVNDCPDHM